MINLIIYCNKLENCKKIIHNMAHLNFNIKICEISTSLFEVKTTLNVFNIDFIIFDLFDKNIEYVNYIHEQIYKKYNIPIFILTNNKNLCNFNIFSKIIVLDSYNLLHDQLTCYIEQNYYSNIIKLIISKELEYLCFNLNHIGTLYISEVIYQVYNNKFYFKNLTKFIYTNLSEKYSISINTLKCDIFQSVLHSYINCDNHTLENYLGHSCIEKPSVKNYIHAIVEHIKSGTLKNSVPNQHMENNSVI